MKKLIICLSLMLISFALFANGVLVVSGYNGFCLHLKDCRVETVINNQVATTTATMRFVNQDSYNRYSTLAFPYPPEASPTGLRWFLNGDWHDAYVAPNVGGSIVPPGHNMYPPLDNYLGKTYLTFRLYEALDPDEEIIYELTYVELLPYQNGIVNYDFRSSYGPLSNPALDSLSVSIQITGNRTINNLNVSGLSDPTINIEGNTAQIQFTEYDYDLVNDLGLSYELAMENLGACTLSTFVESQHVPDNLGDGFFLSVVEPSPSVDVIQKYFTFMFDHSNAMSETNIIQAKEAASYMIQNLNDGDYFNIVDFATTAGTFAVNHVPFNPQNRDLALAYINSLESAGSCNMSAAFDTAILQYASAPPEAAHIIVMLTIGHPTTGIIEPDALVDHIDDLVTTTNREVNIFCFGLGSVVDFQLLSQISAAHRGIATHVGMNDLSGVLTDFYIKIRNPILLSPVLEVVDQGTNISEIYPNQLQNLYLGNQMIICGRYHNPANLVYNIDGYVPGGPVNYHYEQQLNSTTEIDLQFIMKIWAKLKIEHLMALYYQLDPDSPEAIALHDQIVELSINYRVLSSFTNFSGGGMDNSDDNVTPTLKPLQITACSPNPFHSQMNLTVQVGEVKDGILKLRIYNLRGQLIRTISLIADKNRQYDLYWDGRDENGNIVSSGVYLCMLSLSGHTQNTKVVFIK